MVLMSNRPLDKFGAELGDLITIKEEMQRESPTNQNKMKLGSLWDAVENHFQNDYDYYVLE